MCRICKGMLKNTKNRNKHFRDMHWAEAPSYVCPENHLKSCTKMRTSKAAFEMHLSRNHPEWQGVPLAKFIKN